MSKKKDKQSPASETPQDTPEENTSLATTEAPKEEALLDPESTHNSLFMQKYGSQVARAKEELPSASDFQKILDDLPEKYVDGVMGIIRKSAGKQKGVYGGEDDRPDFPELRIYHGTGNDKNRPEDQIPGQFYLTTKETIGKEFVGTVLALWKGRTMWGDSEAGESTRMPVCQSMDRKMGSTAGECAKCPHLPWRDGKKQQCADDVVAFMLTKDAEEIVLVRFQKTSEPAGRQLNRYIQRTMFPWSKWFVITSRSKTSEKDTTRRWFVMDVEPLEDPVSEELHPFCNAMCTSLEHTFILPNIESIYARGQREDVEDPGAGDADPMTGDEDYENMEGAENDVDV